VIGGPERCHLCNRPATTSLNGVQVCADHASLSRAMAADAKKARREREARRWRIARPRPRPPTDQEAA
jgi:hypothetical protein